MACVGCPYVENYDLLWRNEADPEVICVMLWCCAGPELQIRRGRDLLVDEFYPTKELVHQRSKQLQKEWA